MNENNKDRKLGITKQYERQKYDSDAQKRKFKEKQFQGKQVIKDPVTKKELHYSQKSAQNKYHRKNKNGDVISKKWAEHASEVDHIIPLKELHDRNKNNAFLNDSDLKEIANKDPNFRVISKSLNASKQDRSDLQVAFSKENGLPLVGRAELVKQNIKAEVAVNMEIAGRTVSNMGKEFISGAKDGFVNSIVPITVLGIQQLQQVANGEKTLEEAAVDMGKATAGIVVASGTERLLLQGISNALKARGNQILQSLANSTQIAQFITIVSLVMESMSKLLDGEIDGKQFMEEIGQKGTVFVAGMIGGEIGRTIGAAFGTMVVPGVGTAVGAVIGEVIGAVVTSVVCGAIFTCVSTVKEAWKGLKKYQEAERMIKRISSEALREMKTQQEHLEQLIQERNKKWSETIEEGYKRMKEGILNNSFEILNDGLQKIGELFEVNLILKTEEEIDQIFTNKVLTIGRNGGIFE